MLPRLASTRQFPLSFHRYTSRRDGLANRPFHQCFDRSTEILEHTFYRTATRYHPPEGRDGGRADRPDPRPVQRFRTSAGPVVGPDVLAVRARNITLRPPL